jgi:hypothetical protein
MFAFLRDTGAAGHDVEVCTSDDRQRGWDQGLREEGACGAWGYMCCTRWGAGAKGSASHMVAEL